MLIDVDRFKNVNDTFGHQVGDQVLRELSALFKRTVRTYDTAVRWGGEEFLLVLPGVSLEDAQRLADRIRRAVEAIEFPGAGASRYRQVPRGLVSTQLRGNADDGRPPSVSGEVVRPQLRRIARDATTTKCGWRSRSAGR